MKCSVSTLTSLALLKMRIDNKQDYLDSLRPFIQHILATRRYDVVTADIIVDAFLDEFGLVIPDRTIYILLNRLSKAGVIKRENKVFIQSAIISDSNISKHRAEAARKINSVVLGFREYAKSKHQIEIDEENAVLEIIGFLSEFGISCLRAFLTGSAIPGAKNCKSKISFILNQYVIKINNSDSNKFDEFMVLVQGHMFSNALLCPDLKDNKNDFGSVTFYFDTPVIIKVLGLDGDIPKRMSREMVKLLINLRAKIGVLSHTVEETKRVIRYAAECVGSGRGNGPVYYEATRCGRTTSDLLLVAGDIEARLKEIGFIVTDSSTYDKETQIDEVRFEEILQREVRYARDQARRDDIKSIRYMHNLRKGLRPGSIEQSRSVFVTSNTGLVKAAKELGLEYPEAENVPAAISDCTLVNYAWLKAPVGAPSLPAAEVMAYAYAALRPSDSMLAVFLEELDKLSLDESVSPQSIDLLRSSHVALEEAMDITMGDEKALSNETLRETLRRVSVEIKKEESELLDKEKGAHEATRLELENAREQNEKMRQVAYWRANKKAKRTAGIIVAILVIICASGILGIFPALGINWLSIAVVVPFCVFYILSFLNIFNGLSIANLRDKMDRYFMTHYLSKESLRLGVDLSK